MAEQAAAVETRGQTLTLMLLTAVSAQRVNDHSAEAVWF